MPVLAANQVTLAEVLEVKGSPLNEEEIWAVLSQAGKSIEKILAEGKGKQHGQPSLVISPDTLILSHSGHVKVSGHVGREKSKNPTYRAPELSSRTVSPSDGAIEKMYVYSLGMTVYFAAEYALIKSKMAHLSVSLGNLLLSMCEELARSRYSLRQVLAACGSKYGDRFYSKIIKSLVVLVLGNNIPEVIQSSDAVQQKSPHYTSNEQHPSKNLRARYRRSLELPSPPLGSHTSHGQVTSEELIGSNDRTMTLPEDQPSYHSKNKYMTKIPHTLDKYRKYLEKARHQKTMTSPVIADRSIDLLRHRYGSMPVINNHYSSDNPSRWGYERTQSLDRNNKEYGGRAMDNDLWQSGNMRGTGSGSVGNLHTGHSSDASSETSSLSDHHKSTLSSAQSSSLHSLREGSYVPASSLTDLGSDYWGSMGSLRDAGGPLGDTGGPQRSGEWHRSSIGDLRSVSQLSNHDHREMKNGLKDTKMLLPKTAGQRKYRSEQNLLSPDVTDGGKSSKKVPKTKLRNFFGPEFVQMLEDPNKSLVNITPKKSEKQISSRRMVTVVMLNEQRLEMAVESSTKVQELFTQITKYVGITEPVYFGLTRIEEDEHLFLDFDTKLSKYSPPGWKENSKKFTGNYVLYFRVKFYVENLALFRHHVTSHQLYLQLRNDVIKDRIYTDVDPVLHLASLALQAEYGDYNKKRFGENYFKPKHYLPHRILVKLSEEHVCQKLRALHKIQCGLSQEEAEVKFIKESQKLSEYGMHLYKVQWSKKENQIIYLGVCVRGVTIFELTRNKRKPLERYSWSTIKKLAFKKKKFYIEPRKEERGNKHNKLTFLSSSYKRSKYLLHLCTSFHRFQMRMKVRMLAMEETSAVPGEKKRNSLGSGYEPYLNGVNEGKLLNSNDDDVDGSFESRVPSKASSGYGENIRASSSDKEEILPYVLNSTPPSDKTPSPEANQKKTAEIIMSPDRKVKAIKLKKDTRGALGLTVVGGEDTRRLHFGIFIKKISPGSIAHEDGRLQVGDRILAVNGKSLEYVSHDEAVQALKNTPVDVELLVSQSTRTDSNIDMAALYSPTANKTQRPSSSGERRMSPYLVQGQAPPGNMNNSQTNEQLTKVNRNLESSYGEDVLEGNERPQSLRPVDIPLSNPSSPEQGTRKNHYGGVKLPGMADGRMEDVKLTRNGNFRTSVISQASLESPGSIASFGEKVNRQNSLPDSEVQDSERKSSTSSAFNDGRLNRSRSNSGNVVTEDICLNDATSDAQQLPLGVVMDRVERRVSQEDKVLDYFTVELNKVSGSLGLNVAGGINTSTTDGGIFVKSLYPNGPADLDGRIQVGHKILSVNGISLQGVTHRQAVETIKRAPVHAVLVIEGTPGQSADHVGDDSHQNDEQETVFEVVLMKGIGGLGMSLVGGTDCGDEYGDKLRIKAMFPGQPAENSEKLRVGDIIMAANGIPLAGKTSRDAINVLRDQPTRVVLTVKRDPSSIPPGLLRRASFTQSLDPNEVLSAIHSKLNRDESRHSAFDNRPGSEESTPREVHDHHASAVRRSSHTTDKSESLRDKRELPRDGVRASGGNYGHEDTSLDNRGASCYRSETQKEDISGIFLDKSRRPPVELRDDERNYGLKDTSLDNGTISRGNSGQPNNDLGSQLPTKHLSNNRKTTSNNDLPAFDTQAETVETLGATNMASADEKYVLPDPKFRGRLSSEEDDFEQKLDSSHEDFTCVMETDIQPLLQSLVVTSQTGGDVDKESGEKEKRMNSNERTFQNNQKEKLAPPEEVLDIVLHKGSSGLGFTLAGGADTVGGCFVREIIGDPARSDGRLRPKDQIVMVNGQDTTNKKHMEAVNILRSTRNEVHLVIRRRPDKVKSKTKDGLNIKTISVIRTTRGVIGLTLGEDKQGQIYAAEVVPDEPAAKDGGLKPGDVILEINGERLDGGDLNAAVDCLERARPVATLVIKQFRSETESKYVLCSPTESDHEVPAESSRAHNYNMAVLPPQNNYMQDIPSYNPDFLPSDETSPENLPTGVLLPEIEPTREQQPPVFLSSENMPLKEPHIEMMQNKSFESSEQDLRGERNMESLSADESYSEEKITSFDAREKGDTSQGHENEDYLSDDDDVILKEEVIITSLEKGPRGLGFSLFSGQTVHDTPGLFIRSIQPNSVVAEDGKIKVGDQLMKVNGENVERLDHSEVITLLRSLSGIIELELLRFIDGEEDDEASTSLPRQPDVSEQTRDSDKAGVFDTSNSPVTTPDFSEDVGIVLDALHTKYDLPLSNSQESIPTLPEKRPAETTEKADVLNKPCNESVETEEERLESWPQPPTSLELECSDVVQEPNNSIENHIATSEEETTSITFSEDGFLEELEDLQYTPSPESERVRSGNISERSEIPVKPGSTLSHSISPRISEQLYETGDQGFKQENIEMSVLKRSSNIEHSSPFLKDKARISIDNLVENTVAETNMSLLEGSVSPLIPESFLNASLAASSSQATSPEVPPPLPTTPLPSDEDLSGNTGQKVTPRDPMKMRERFVEVVKQENKGRFDYPLRPKSPLIGRRSKSVEPSGPLLKIQGSNSLYSGQQLQNIIQKLENAITSGKAAGEFQALREMKPVDNCPSGKRALNKEKNRYRNVLPYEKTRVILNGDEQMDYINANFITVTVDTDTYHYIATQGPLPITTNDFWRMVWEQKCQVVAMVTLDMECGKVKCHRYWPESSELPVKVGPSLEVHLESVETHRNFIERIMRIENIQEERSLNIVHLNFVAWPDHGVPKSAFELVEFIKQFRKNTSVGPSIVHCSAGIGRTGTLLTIDTCMKHIERDLEFDIYGVVHDLRMQRPGMIQTKDQYLFCYQACMEILKSLQV